jgi:Ca2+:H+ antiporter
MMPGVSTDSAPAVRPPTFDRKDRILITGAAVLVVASAVVHGSGAPPVLGFVVTAAAVAVLAALVGAAVDQLSERLNAGATGILQSALGNLPELFICLFALRAGLTEVATSAVIGSILANILLVLGLAFAVGGLKLGTQTFSSSSVRVMVSLMLLSVGVMLMPSLTAASHTPAADHEQTLSVIAAIVLLVVFACSLPFTLRSGSETPTVGRRAYEEPRWSLRLAIGVLTITAVLAAVVSDWFVDALEPAITALGISQTFAGLVIVAIAGNAVENVVGVQLAAADKMEYALSVILNSPVQIALVLAPLLVLLSPLVAPVAFTLVFSPLLMASVVIAMLVVTVIVLDGESNWLEGVALVGLYIVIAASFWWG